LEHEARGDEKGKEPEQRTRFAGNPTRAGEFTPNASDHESNGQTDSEWSDGSNKYAPTKQKLDQLSGWVEDVIKSEASKQSERMVAEFFTSNNPHYERRHEFFEGSTGHGESLVLVPQRYWLSDLCALQSHTRTTTQVDWNTF
jgi:hypothetical protein